jgi:hypothetical protein
VKYINLIRNCVKVLPEQQSNFAQDCFNNKNSVMKRKFLLPGILFAGLMLLNFSVNQVYGQTPQNTQVKQQTVMYTCPMHPEVIQDHPGKCPKCGMTLVEKKELSKGTLHETHDSTCMKQEDLKMMHHSTMMKKDHMMRDTTMMRRDHMMHDSTMMKRDHMMHDTTSMKHDHMKM